MADHNLCNIKQCVLAMQICKAQGFWVGICNISNMGDHELLYNVWIQKYTIYLSLAIVTWQLIQKQNTTRGTLQVKYHY